MFKKGDKVMVVGFTGMKLGRFEVVKATKSSATIKKADGTELIFSQKTLKQTNVEEGKERYASRIEENDPNWESPLRKKAKAKKKNGGKKSAKKTKKPVKPEIPEEDELDEFYEEDFEDFEDEE